MQFVDSSSRMRWAGHVARYGEEKCREGFELKIWRKATTRMTHA